MRRLASVATMAVVLGCGASPWAETPAARGRAVYLERCASCHGEDLQGKRTAPPLVDMAKHWDAASLVRYLEDPAGVSQRDPCLLHVAGRYTLRMPSFASLPPTQWDDLLAFLFMEPVRRHSIARWAYHKLRMVLNY